MPSKNKINIQLSKSKGRVKHPAFFALDMNKPRNILLTHLLRKNPSWRSLRICFNFMRKSDKVKNGIGGISSSTFLLVDTPPESCLIPHEGETWTKKETKWYWSKSLFISMRLCGFVASWIFRASVP
jgi:hypothetical protein